MARPDRESEYRYYGAIEADEPLPASSQPNPHRLPLEVREEIFALSRKLRTLEAEIERLVWQDSVVPRRLEREHNKLLAALEHLSQTGKRP